MTSPTAPPSPPPSPQAPTQPQLPAISRILLWNSRRRSKQTASQDGCATVAAASNPPKNLKAPLVECSSGSELKTHGRLVDGQPECRSAHVITHEDVFVCLDGVDTVRLLLLTRRRVFEKVELLGGNAIIDERWSCTICEQETRRGIFYKVSIQYQGTPARCALPDPQRPVATDRAERVSGLMTVVSRQ